MKLFNKDTLFALIMLTKLSLASVIIIVDDDVKPVRALPGYVTVGLKL